MGPAGRGTPTRSTNTTSPTAVSVSSLNRPGVAGLHVAQIAAENSRLKQQLAELKDETR